MAGTGLPGLRLGFEGELLEDSLPGGSAVGIVPTMFLPGRCVSLGHVCYYVAESTTIQQKKKIISRHMNLHLHKWDRFAVPSMPYQSGRTPYHDGWHWTAWTQTWSSRRASWGQSSWRKRCEDRPHHVPLRRLCVSWTCLLLVQSTTIQQKFNEGVPPFLVYILPILSLFCHLFEENVLQYAHLSE